MSETQETAAPVQTETATETTAPAAAGAAVGVEGDWLSALDETTRATALAKAWKSPADPAKAYLHSQREYQDLKSKALVPPTADSKPEDIAAFWSKLGVPDKAESYEFKLPDGLPPNLPYDAQAADKFKNWSLSAKLTPQQSQAVHDEFVRDYAAQVSAIQEAQEKAAAASHNAIVKEYGEPGTPEYERAKELATRTLRQHGLEPLIDEFKSSGMMGPNGEILKPALFKMLHKLGADNYQEDRTYGGPTSMGPNPFADASVDMAKQGEIIRKAPDHARALIRQTGSDPKEWGL